MDIMVRMTGAGGPDRLELAANPSEEPGSGEIRLRHEAIGVNFLDIYHRTGRYPLPSLPAVLGVEGAGVIEAVGSGVTRLTVGDRVAYAGTPIGAYAATRLLPETRAVLLPAGIPARLAAASMLKGLTAHMLMTRTYPVGPQSTVLVHAAAGGLGGLLTRWAKHLGAVVIGAVGSVEKADFARAAGADHVIVGRNADIVAEVGRITAGRGVDFAIDGIGGTTLAKTLGCVRKFGTVASIGQAAGPVPPLAVELLGPPRSLSLARPSVMTYAAETETYQRAAVEVFELLQAGIAPTIGGEYALADAAQAHTDLEAGRSTGSLLLLP
jgi:NADPH2:quinone reductase